MQCTEKSKQSQRTRSNSNTQSRLWRRQRTWSAAMATVAQWKQTDVGIFSVSMSIDVHNNYNHKIKMYSRWTVMIFFFFFFIFCSSLFLSCCLTPSAIYFDSIHVSLSFSVSFNPLFYLHKSFLRLLQYLKNEEKKTRFSLSLCLFFVLRLVFQFQNKWNYNKWKKKKEEKKKQLCAIVVQNTHEQQSWFSLSVFLDRYVKWIIH